MLPLYYVDNYYLNNNIENVFYAAFVEIRIIYQWKNTDSWMKRAGFKIQVNYYFFN